MEFINLAKNRYSCRHFLPLEIDKDLVISILDAARVAPSAANRQPWHFIVVNDKKIKSELLNAYPRDWMNEAPVIIIVCGDKIKSWKRQVDGKYHVDIDVAIATDHITLAATDAGLATCWICAFKPEIVKKILNIPDHLEPYVLLPIGYPADVSDIHRHQILRKNLNEIVSWNRF